MGVRQKHALSYAQSLKYEDDKELNLCIITVSYIYITYFHKSNRVSHPIKEVSLYLLSVKCGQGFICTGLREQSARKKDEKKDQIILRL